MVQIETLSAEAFDRERLEADIQWRRLSAEAAQRLRAQLEHEIRFKTRLDHYLKESA